MPFSQILGQATAVDTLTRALRGDLVHHAYRFEGPAGVGKTMAATALAQALLCTAGDPLGCGSCDACRRAATLPEGEPRVPLHPDVVYVGRGVYPEAILGKKETKEISVTQIRRVVISRASYSAHEGRAQIFIIHDADEMSIGAANALLKILEEPRPGTHFVLVTSRPDKLLDTIRSRSLPVRFGPLPNEVVASVLKERGVDAARIPELVEMAGGSAALAIEASDDELSTRRSDFIEGVTASLSAPDMLDAVRFAESIPSDRKQLLEDLRALATVFVRRAREQVGRDPEAAERTAVRHALVLDAIDNVERNGSNALVVAGLIGSLRKARQRRPGTKPPIVVTRR